LSRCSREAGCDGSSQQYTQCRALELLVNHTLSLIVRSCLQAHLPL
jgi:hypothetical protein